MFEGSLCDVLHSVVASSCLPLPVRSNTSTIWPNTQRPCNSRICSVVHRHPAWHPSCCASRSLHSITPHAFWVGCLDVYSWAIGCGTSSWLLWRPLQLSSHMQLHSWCCQSNGGCLFPSTWITA